MSVLHVIKDAHDFLQKNRGHRFADCIRLQLAGYLPDNIDRLVEEPLSAETIITWTDENCDLWCVVPISLEELACIGKGDGTLSGLNEYMDQAVFGKVVGMGEEYSYSIHTCDEENIYIRFVCNVGSLINLLT